MNEKIGLYIGRFQPFHNGHRAVVMHALQECDTLIIAVGSSQECRTKRNPFSFLERKRMIDKSCRLPKDSNKRIIIVAVPDRAMYGDDGSWGKYVLDRVEEACGLRPTINFEGSEQCRSTWFDGIEIERVVIAREELPISATMVREALVEDRFGDYCKMVPTALWLLYDTLAKILILEVEK